MIIPILSTGERDGKNRRVFGPKINETFLTLEGRIISTWYSLFTRLNMLQANNNIVTTFL